MLSIEEAKHLEPRLTGDFAGAAWFDEPWIDVDEYYEALRRVLFKRNNIEFMFRNEVGKIEDIGSATYVHTKYERLEAPFVVLVTGLNIVELQRSLKICIEMDER